MQLQDDIRLGFFVEDLAKLFYSGAVRWRSLEGKRVYEMYRLAKLGIMPWMTNGGSVYQEDLTYLLKCEELEAEGQARRMHGGWKEVG